MLRGTRTQPRFSIRYSTLLGPTPSIHCVPGIRFASFTRSPSSGPSANARNGTGPRPALKPGSNYRPGSGPNSAARPGSGPDAAAAGPYSRRQSKSNEPPTKPRDENIPFSRVCLADPDTGVLGPLTQLSEVINAVRSRPGPNSAEQSTDGDEDKKVKWWKQRKYCVELVVDKPTPIVRIVDLGSEYQKNKEAAKKKKEGVVKEKEVQMTWSVAQGDLEHKLKKAREALDEGERVTIGFARKKGQGYPQREEMTVKLQETADSLADVADEWKERAVLPNHTGFLYLKKKP